jgi:hypothetical protein
MLKDKYLRKLLESGRLESPISRIATIIESDGHYSEFAEWRMGTNAEVTISKLTDSSGSSFAVRVNYDYDFQCTCPNLERAIQMAGLFLQLIIKLDEQVGWPSSA